MIHSHVRSGSFSAVAISPSLESRSFALLQVTVLPAIWPSPLAVSTLPGKVTLTSKSVNMLSLSVPTWLLVPSPRLLPLMWKVHRLDASS